jgi:hypothetical protein
MISNPSEMVVNTADGRDVFVHTVLADAKHIVAVHM